MIDLWKPCPPKIHLGVRSNGLPFWPSNLSLTPADYQLHQWVIGISKSGKTGYLETQILQLIRHGIGVSFIDPHGDAAEDLLRILTAQGFFDQPSAFDRLWYIEFDESEDGTFVPF